MGIDATSLAYLLFYRLCSTVLLSARATSGIAYYERFEIEEFKPGLEPFTIKIGNNVFSLSGVELDINGKLSVKGSLRYSDLSLFRGGLGMRGVMG